MFYSSGTTGRPKGVLRPLTGKTIDANPGGKMAANFLGMDPGAVYLSTAPLYHTAALGFAAATQALGGTCVLMERFDAEEALRAIEIYGVTHTQWVPTMFKRLLSLPPEVRGRYDLSTHRVALHGAAPCPIELKRQIIEWWGPIVLEYYGATEGNGMTVIDSTEWLAHVGSVGQPVFGSHPHLRRRRGARCRPGRTASSTSSATGSPSPTSRTTPRPRPPATPSTRCGRRWATSATSTRTGTST